jgi:GNAT superfamily N-acetyltransferase
MKVSYSVRRVDSSDEERLVRWLAAQDKIHTKVSVSDLADWLATHRGFLAEHGSEPVGLLLYAETSRKTVSIIGLAVGNEWNEGEVLSVLFRKAFPSLRRQAFSTLTCVTSANWASVALRRYLQFDFMGNLASYVKVDQHVPEFGNLSVQVSPASSADVDDLLNVDRAAFPSIWRQDEQAIFAPLQSHGYLFKAEWRGQTVGYASGVWNERHGHINRLAVHPQVHGLGIGKRLLAESIRQFHKVGVYRITLNTQVDNRISRRLYERFGFQITHCEIEVLVRTI